MSSQFLQVFFCEKKKKGEMWVVSDDRMWAEVYLIKSCMQDCISVELPADIA